jgi:hypothetical protein
MSCKLISATYKYITMRQFYELISATYKYITMRQFYELISAGSASVLDSPVKQLLRDEQVT